MKIYLHDPKIFKKGSYTVGKHIFLRVHYSISMKKDKYRLRAYRIMLSWIKGKSLTDCAKTANISRGRVTQIINSQLRKFRELQGSKILKVTKDLVPDTNIGHWPDAAAAKYLKVVKKEKLCLNCGAPHK